MSRNYTMMLFSMVVLSACTVYRQRNWTGDQVTKAEIDRRPVYVVEQGTEHVFRLDSASMDSTGLRGRPAVIDTTTAHAVLYMKKPAERKLHRTDVLVVTTSAADSLVSVGTTVTLPPSELAGVFTEAKDIKASRAATAVLTLFMVLLFVVFLLAMAVAASLATMFRGLR